MDENHSTQYEFEAVPEPAPYTPYHEPEEPKKKKKDRTTAKILLLVAVVAIIGSVGGALLSNAIDRLRGNETVDEPAGPDVSLEQQETLPEGPFELVKHQLPKELITYDTGKTLTPAEVYELTVASIVGIDTQVSTNIFGQEAVAASTGSGFILSEDGYIITNAHVVSGANTIEVSMYDGETYDAVLVAADSSFDIAVLKVEAEGLPAAAVGDSDSLRVGEEVVAIGNPLGELTFTMTNGILSALDREINIDGNPQNMLQTNAAINSGNSGGALFDMDGNIIGVTTAKYTSTATGTAVEGLGFAIPINMALRVAYDLVKYGYVKGQAYLGVVVRTLDSETAAYYSLPIGPRVETINPGSCVEKAGMQVGDIILWFNETQITSNTDLLSALKKVKAGDTVTLGIFRAGQELDLSVTLDEKPNQAVLDAQVAEQEQQTIPEDNGQYYYEFPFGFGN